MGCSEIFRERLTLTVYAVILQLIDNSSLLRRFVFLITIRGFIQSAVLRQPRIHSNRFNSNSIQKSIFLSYDTHWELRKVDKIRIK